MTWYLLDTNHLSAFLDEQPRVTSRVEKAMLDGDRFGVALPVLCEYRAGIARGSRVQSNLRRLNKAMRSLRFWPTDQQTAIEFAALSQELRSAGRIIPSFDTLIAASARQLGLTLLTADRHFDAVPQLNVENWIA